MVDCQEVKKILCCSFGNTGQTLAVGTDSGFRIYSTSVPEDFEVPFGKARIRREGKDLSIITYGNTVHFSLEAAEELAKEGFDLILVARDLPRLNKVAKELSKRFGVKAQCIKADLTKPSQLAKVEKRVADLKKPIDVLVNNAGFGINKRNFTLLGDPAMRLTYPKEIVITEPQVSKVNMMGASLT